MGVAECFTFVQKGDRTGFDILIGLLEEVEKAVQGMESHTEFHPGDGPIPEGWSEATSTDEDVLPFVVPHFYDPKEGLLERLAEAKKTVDDIWYLVLEALEAIG
jgi:hypothetical protein